MGPWPFPLNPPIFRRVQRKNSAFHRRLTDYFQGNFINILNFPLVAIWLILMDRDTHAREPSLPPSG